MIKKGGKRGTSQEERNPILKKARTPKFQCVGTGGKNHCAIKGFTKRVI